MSISDLAAAILADRIRFSDDEPATVLQEGAPTKCFACAASFTYRKDPVDGRNGQILFTTLSSRIRHWRCTQTDEQPPYASPRGRLRS